MKNKLKYTLLLPFLILILLYVYKSNCEGEWINEELSSNIFISKIGKDYSGVITTVKNGTVPSCKFKLKNNIIMYTGDMSIYSEIKKKEELLAKIYIIKYSRDSMLVYVDVKNEILYPDFLERGFIFFSRVY